MPGRRTRTEVRVSLAVVPVQDRADLLGDVAGMLAGLATWLAVLRVPPTPVESPADLQRIGQSTGARYVLHGWTDTERDRVRLTVELNEAGSGRVLWSDRLDRSRPDRDELRTIMAQRIGQVVAPAIVRRERDRLALLAPETLAPQAVALLAFDAILRPRRAGFADAADALSAAAARGGVQTGVRVALVWWHLMAVSQGWSGDLAVAAAVAAELDLNDPAAAALRAHVQSIMERDHAAASATLDRVLDVTPRCAIAGSFKALALGWLGDTAGAIAHAEQAAAMPVLGPERAWLDHVPALLHYLAGRYENATRWARRSVGHHPGLAANLRVLAASLAVLGRLDEAQQAAEQVLLVDPEFRIGTWQEHSPLSGAPWEVMAQRLRLAGLAC
jgi:tetratricopeptide (TPR) repeat protein